MSSKVRKEGKSRQKIKKRKQLLWLTGIFILLSFLLFWVSGMFRYDQYLGHVQEYHRNINKHTTAFFEGQTSLVKLFFTIDFFWAFLLVYLGRLLFIYLQAKNKLFPEKWQSEIGFTILLAAAYFLDLTEGILNWRLIDGHLDVVSSLKLVYAGKSILYGLAGLLLLVQAGVYMKQRHWTAFKHYWRFNKVSIFVILILVYVVTRMDQGAALLDSLIDKQWNLLFFVILLDILIVMTWHWPYYHYELEEEEVKEEKKENNNEHLTDQETDKEEELTVSEVLELESIGIPPKAKDRSDQNKTVPEENIPITKQKLDKYVRSRKPNLDFLSVIQQQNINPPTIVQDGEDRSIELEGKEVVEQEDDDLPKNIWRLLFSISYFREPVKKTDLPKLYWYDFQRLQAIFIFGLVAYTISYHLGKSLSADGPTLLSSFFYALPVFLFIGITLLYFNFKYSFERARHQSFKVSGKKGWPKWVMNYRAFLYSSLILALVGGLFISFSGAFSNYKLAKFSGLIIFLLANAILLIKISIARTEFKDLTTKENETIIKLRTFEAFHLSKMQDMHMVYALAFFFLFSIIAFFSVNIFPSLSKQIHPINITLISLIFYFGIANYYTKKGNEANYYSKGENGINLRRPFLNILLCIFLVLGLLLVAATSIYDNEYHLLELIDETKTGITGQEFLNQRVKAFPLDPSPDSISNSDNSPSFFLIASDGGGLRAAYWTLLVMNELDKQTEGSLYDQTLALSGVSGGMVGLGMYFAMKRHGLDTMEQKILIDSLGKENFLSNDLSHLLGEQQLSNFIPCPLIRNLNDAAETMAGFYTDLLPLDNGKRLEKTSTFRDYWLGANTKAEGKTPLLIVNTTQSETAFKGIGDPFRRDLNYFKPSISILNFPQHDSLSISFQDAVFISNRFPIFSPAAQLKNLGYFLDGGYYDNSGISSLMDLVDHFESDLTLKEKFTQFNGKIVLISIQNDVSRLIWNDPDLAKFDQHKDKINIKGEIGPVLSGVAKNSTLAIPTFWDRKAEELKEKGVLKDYIKINLPHMLDRTKIQSTLNGRIKDDSLNDLLEKENQKVIMAINGFNTKMLANSSEARLETNYYVNPPLARILSNTIIDYMNAMLEHEDVENSIKKIVDYSKQ